MMKKNKQMPTWKVFFRLLGLVHGLEGWMILAILAGVAGFICALGIPVIGMAAALSTPESSWQISFGLAVFLLIVFAVLRGVLRYGEQACNHYIAFRLLAQIRDKVFARLRILGPARLDGKQKGDLISLITSDVELLEVFYAHTISPVCIALISAILYCLAGSSIHWSIGALLIVSYFCVSFVIPFFFGKKAQKTGIARREANGALGSVVLENVHAIDEITQYQMEEKRKTLMDEKTDALLSSETDQRRQTIQVSNTALFFVTLFGVLMALVSMDLARKGLISWQQAFTAVVFQASSFGPFMALANLSTGLSQTMGAARRVIGLLDEEPVTPEVTQGVQPAFEGMAAEKIDFSYDQVPVLENFSESFKKGEMIGIEGKSGCGKSTLLRLLMRFYDPARGKVSLSSHDLKNVETDALRQKQSVVLQDTVLFTDTIKNNLKMARPDASDEQIKEACKKASIDQLIESLPEGYDTMLAEGGSSLSSGEKQRLGLARAFLHDADMMLLDEPTSNLDSLNEGAILRSVAKEARGKTVVLISHRKGTLSFADRIIEMEENHASRKKA